MFLGQHSIATENTIMGDAPVPIERRLILPTLENMSFGDLRYIADSIEKYSGEVQAALEQKREERIAELKDQVEADKARTAATEAELAALQPQPTKMANPSTPKYRDPAKPENTRLKADQVSAKQRAKGRVIWDSRNQGTYVRAKHGPLR